MPRHGRRSSIVLATIAVVASIQFGGGVLAADHPPHQSAWQSDAWLFDVSFVDAERGWAVGDQGAIWHTSDGGRSWRWQASGVEAPLRSVHFIDADNGWAAGGWTLPVTGQTAGLVLRTRDGGKNWEHDPRLPLPALTRIEFFNGANGWAAGQPCGLFPAGVFVTDNGGRSWDPLSGATARAWLAADFIDQEHGALAGKHGAALAANRGLTEARTDPWGARSPRGIKLATDGSGWLVGDGGLVLHTRDAGKTWGPPPAPIPAILAEGCDWSALEVRGENCWIAGTPGSRVLHSSDAGRTWHEYPTGQTLPLSALSFADEQHGWAVGALGLILATQDSGRTWRPCRSGGTRAAAAGFYAQPEDIPLELFARLSAGDGWLAVAQVLGHRDDDLEQAGASPFEFRTHQALAAVGACGAQTAWRFPLRDAALELTSAAVLAGWDRANDGAGAARLEEHLVRQIRVWRPDVIFTHSLGPRQADTAAGLVAQAVLKAVTVAAEENCFPEQIQHLGLAPWNVKKVYSSLPPGDFGAANVTTSQIVPRLARSLADQSAVPRAWLTGRLVPPQGTLGFGLMHDLLPQSTGEGDFFNGISLAPGSEARRLLQDPPPDSLDLLRRAAQRHRNVQAILARASNPVPDAPSGTNPSAPPLTGQVADLLAGLDEAEAGLVLFQLGQGCHANGQWTQAAEALGMLAERYPRHPLTPAALVWLVQFWSSAEAAQRQADTARLSDRAARAVALGKHLEKQWPLLYAEPAVRFPLAVAYRRQGQDRQAERYLLSLRRGRPADAWRSAAEGERWLPEGAGATPKSVARCAASPERPHLDGDLSDSIWQTAASVELRSPLRDDKDWPAVALLARDQEFLYLAVRCGKAPQVRYVASSGPRPRDPDLSTHDRVDFLFDLDRDAATAFRLTVDHRGWTGEDCWHDRTWDPEWFVAAAEDDATWTIEAAIELKQLAPEPPQPREAWGLGIQRLLPGVGFQSWTIPASPTPHPEAFGYLLFE